MALDITFTEDDADIMVFHLAGRLDATEAPVAYDRMIQDLGEKNRVVLDLAEVDYVSSGGLSIIIRLVHHLRNAGGDLHLASPQPFVQKVFDIIKAIPSMQIFTSMEELDSYLDAMQKSVTDPDG